MENGKNTQSESAKTKQDLIDLWSSYVEQKKSGLRTKFIVQDNPGFNAEVQRVCNLYDNRTYTKDLEEVLMLKDGSMIFVAYKDFDWVFLIMDDAELGFWKINYADLPGRSSMKIKKELKLS